MIYLRVSLSFLFALLLGCGGKSESVIPEGILVSWLAETDKSKPCIVVANKVNSDRLLNIGKQNSDCFGGRKVIVHNPSDVGLARILSTLPANPKSSDSDSEAYPWYVIRLKMDGFDSFRLNDDESQVLFKSVAEDSPPQLREEINGRLVHATLPGEAGKEFQSN